MTGTGSVLAANGAATVTPTRTFDAAYSFSLSVALLSPHDLDIVLNYTLSTK